MLSQALATRRRLPLQGQLCTTLLCCKSSVADTCSSVEDLPHILFLPSVIRHTCMMHSNLHPHSQTSYTDGSRGTSQLQPATGPSCQIPNPGLIVCPYRFLLWDGPCARIGCGTRSCLELDLPRRIAVVICPELACHAVVKIMAAAKITKITHTTMQIN